MPQKCLCRKRAIFNIHGETFGICCAKCKTDEMTDVVNKRCPCGKQPSFNVPGESIAMCCAKCKTIDMINVVSKRCSCGRRPAYNTPGKKPICCNKCKTIDMINVVSKRCPCGKVPIFGMPGKSKGVCCKDCKTHEMIDVVNKKCPCGKQPFFNVPEEKVGMCCSKCKTDEMIDVIDTKCPCGIRPSYNVSGQTFGICCLACKTDDMINVVSKICPGYDVECPVRTRLSNGHKYCMLCDPNDARRKQYKRFEEEFFEYVKDKLAIHKREFHVLFDQSETAKKYARLDGIVIDDGIVVCLEIDENGHLDYECDEHRMHLVTAELLQKYPDKTVSWVRVNPTVDAKSQWSKTSKKIREKRFEDVVMTVKDILENSNTSVVYIGFD